LRFAETEGGPFLAQEEAKRLPLLVALPKLLSAAEHVIDETDTDEDRERYVNRILRKLVVA
jgi:serine/threonine-protein kinase HipA